MRVELTSMVFPVLVNATPDTFVDQWSQRYVDAREDLYTSNIGLPLTPDRVNSLFLWKNRGPLSANKQNSVLRNYIERLDELPNLPPHTTAADFLKVFDGGGAIWRIFWLHCWKPERFPIYDRHVHRSMIYMTEQRIEEIPEGEAIIRSYLNRYLPFWEELPSLPGRAWDKALWTFGRFLRSFPPRKHMM
jgi:hypothetical protein